MILPGEYDIVEDWIVSDWPHLCSVTRRIQIGTTPLREPVWEDQIYHDEIPCLYWWRSGGERREGDRSAIVYEHRLLIARTIDIRESDIIEHIRDHRGQIMSLPRMAIESIGRRATNHSLVLREVR